MIESFIFYFSSSLFLLKLHFNDFKEPSIKMPIPLFPSSSIMPFLENAYSERKLPCPQRKPYIHAENQQHYIASVTNYLSSQDSTETGPISLVNFSFFHSPEKLWKTFIFPPHCQAIFVPFLYPQHDNLPFYFCDKSL